MLLPLVLPQCQSITGDSRFAPDTTNIQAGKIGVYVPDNPHTERNLIKDINKTGSQALSLTKLLEFADNNEQSKKLSNQMVLFTCL
ncbi:hypothetical protein ACPV5O_26085 [Vibrio maritimus]|uniref:hypothetical protein n=1 Tax=Vibrio maritimus TaxID=990268 RepID=UPI0040691AF3